jgi:C1A family cysteine protease
MSEVKRKYGWRPDKPDQRDHKFINMMDAAHLPGYVDLRSYACPVIYDQGNLGSCTGQAIAGAVEYDIIRQDIPTFIPSRLFIYYNERALEGTVNEDAGAEIRDGIKVIASQGVCHEKLWPYDISRYTERPDDVAYTDALNYTGLSYRRIDSRFLNNLKSALAQGFPFVCGIAVYESFESSYVANTGIVPMPHMNEQFLGGHAVCCVGYRDSTQRFIMRNSWGTSWGDKGYFTIPYTYLTNLNLADDFWTITKIK